MGAVSVVKNALDTKREGFGRGYPHWVLNLTVLCIIKFKLTSILTENAK